jgi:hypothetical protein
MKNILEEEILRQLKLMKLKKNEFLMEQNESNLSDDKKVFCKQLLSKELTGKVSEEQKTLNREYYPECYKKTDNSKYTNNLKDKSVDARLARYKSGKFKNIYDLIYLNELGKKNNTKEIKNLKYKTNPLTGLGIEYEISEKNDAIKKGYDIFLKALNTRRNNAKYFGWSGDEIYKPGKMDVLMPMFFQMLPPSTAIDPTYIEGVLWVEKKEQWLKLNYELFKIKQTIKLNYGAPYRKDGGFPVNNSTNTQNVVDDKKILEILKRDPEAIKIKKQMSDLQSEIDQIVTVINMTNQWNTELSFQKNDWKNKSCFTETIYKLPKKNMVNLPKRRGTTYCDTENTYIKYKISDVCKQKGQGGLWVQHADMKWRKDFKGIDWKKLDFIFKKENRPGVLACGCATGSVGRLEYDVLPIKTEIYQACYESGEVASINPISYVKTGIIKTVNVEVRKLENVVVDARSVIEKVTDWGKNCFTCNSSEEKTDCHCLLDVASIAAVFIPEIGPIISMLIDVSNGIYYLVDALNSENKLDRNSAYLSAALTILGGIATGYGQLRAVTLSKPNGKNIVSFAENLLSEINKRGLKTESEILKLTEELKLSYKLTNSEIKIANKYIDGIKTMKSSKIKGALKEFRDTFKTLKTKLSNYNFNLLMENKNFKEILIKNKGNIITSLKDFSKKEVNRELLTQIGFFVGGESILPKIIEPWATEKIKTGKWGSIEQQISANNYDYKSVKDEFKSSGNKKDTDLLTKAWNDNKAIKINNQLKPWRPGYPVPVKYQTDLYKKMLLDKQKEEDFNKKYEEETKDIDSGSDSENYSSSDANVLNNL